MSIDFIISKVWGFCTTPPGDMVEEGGPGQSSALTLLYAGNPKDVIQKVEKILHDLRAKLKSTRTGADDEASVTQFSPRALPIPRETPSEIEVAGSKESVEKRRPVLIVVTHWPTGTMGIKFGGAMQFALGAAKGEMALVQMGPERIFRVETQVSEADFRKVLASFPVECNGAVLFIEIPTK